ncbi:Nicotianamine synthase [Morus notabilis]|uniref:Nicotianamine synthase n=1 Tax=Morus notabilis TaxID=981085 RepID=W9RVW1_9ROSA|nr:nicotianamine synthase [Morus notabilis]EXB98412.1 Nicotianamine synthase [Morus notabilis]
MFCQDQEPLITKVCQLYDQISRLSSLKPSKDVDTLFTQLVLTCIPPNPIDVNKLCKPIQNIRSNLIRLCGEAEGHLESHFSTLLASYQNPLQNLNIFPYYSNYLKLSQLEYNILSQHLTKTNIDDSKTALKIAFIGSGPLPLTSIVLASNHLKTASFHNYDIDPLANSKAEALVSSDPDLSNRMFFHTTDIMDVTTELEEYDVVFLAALVGMDKEEKVRVIRHVAKHMAPGNLLMLRSAHGARAFLYPVVDPCTDLKGFDVLSVYHPTDEVINSVVIARKYLYDDDHDPIVLPMQSLTVEKKQGIINGTGTVSGQIVLPSKCFHEIEAFSPLNIHGKYMVEELAFEEQL